MKRNKKMTKRTSYFINYRRCQPGGIWGKFCGVILPKEGSSSSSSNISTHQARRCSMSMQSMKASVGTGSTLKPTPKIYVPIQIMIRQSASPSTHTRFSNLATFPFDA